MRFKKSIILALFLLCILMISAVSASENITYKTDNLEEKTILDSEKSSDTNSININDIDDNLDIKNDESKNKKNEISNNEDNIKSNNNDYDVKLDNDSDKLHIYIASDRIETTEKDIEFLETIKTEIGDRAIVVIDPQSPHPAEASRIPEYAAGHIQNNSITGKCVALYIAYYCSGTTYDLVEGTQGYLKKYTDYLDGICFAYYGDIQVNESEFIRRAWDDNFSDERFAGLYYPYKYMTEGGLGFIQAKKNGADKTQMIKTIAEGILEYAETANKTHITSNHSELSKYIAWHDFSPVELAIDANNLLNGKATNLDLSKWIYYTSQYIGAQPIRNTSKNFILPTTYIDSSFNDSFILSRLDYRAVINKIREYMEENCAAPAYIIYNGNIININDYCYMLAKIISKHTDKTNFTFMNSFEVVKSPITIINNTDLEKELDAAKNQIATFITSDIQAKTQIQELEKENTALQKQLNKYEIESKPNLKLTTKTIKKSKNNQLKAILKFSGKTIKGKTVTFIFNGKVYTTKTNKNGLAKITIKKSALKKFKVGKKVYYYVIYGDKNIKKAIKIRK